MAYFKPSSRHPDTLICVKNHAISELQWRTKDLLQLAEQSHALGKITLLTSALPHIKKNGLLAAASKVKKNAELLTSKWQIVTETITLAPEDEQKSNADFSRAGSLSLKDPSFIKVAEIRLPEMSPADSEPHTDASTNPVVPQAEISPHSLSSPVYSPAAVSSAVNTSPAQPRALAKSFDNNSTASSSSLPWLGVSLLVAADAGGGGGGGGSDPSNNNQLDNKQLSTDTNTSLQGLVMAGPLKAGHGLTVNVFDNRGQMLASQVPVDESGHFSVSLTNVTGNDVLQGLHDGKSMLNGNAGNDVLMAYGNGSQLDGGIADDWLWMGGNSVGTGGQGGDNFIFFKGQTALPDLAGINARITDFDPSLDHIFSYETSGIFTQAQFDLSGQLSGWAQVNDTSFIQTLTQQQNMSAKPDLLAVSMSGSSLTLSFDQPLITTGNLSCQLDGLALQSSSLSGKSLTLNYTNTGSGLHQLDFANAPVYSMLGMQLGFTKLYLGTVNGEQIDASAASASVVLFGNGGADTLLGGSSSDLLVAPTATSATLRGGSGADVFRIKNAGMNGNITIDDFNITQGDHLDLDELLSGFAADSFIEDCVQLTKSSNDALLKFDLSGDGVFNTSNALSIQLSGIYTRQTVAEVTLRSLMYGLQADTVI